MLSRPSDLIDVPAERVVETAAGPASASSPARTPRSASLPPWRRRFADSAYLVLTVSCWLVSNLLAVLGCAIVAFAVLGGGDWDATFMHIDNLASRYVEADVGRRLAFQHQLVQSFTALLVAVVIIRAPGFVRRMRRELEEGPRP